MEILFKRVKSPVLLLFAFSIFVFSLSSWTNQRKKKEQSYLFEYPRYFGNRIQVPEDNPTTTAGVYLGRRLFYEVRLSVNNRLSCASCHEQRKSFTDGKARSLGTDNTLSERNSMALVNMLWARRFFWDGRSAMLEEQAVFPLENPHEMGQPIAISVEKLSKTQYYPPLFKAAFGTYKIDKRSITKALAQFQRTLISANSKYDNYLQGKLHLSDKELLGMELFNSAPDPKSGKRGANCAHCHGGEKNYLELFHNNGLDSVYRDQGMGQLTQSASDMGRFKVPTLRNIALTSPYMHDGRFATLSEVIEHYSEHVKKSPSLSAFMREDSNQPGGSSLKLLPVEKQAILAFLNTLTDSTFIVDKRFSNPFHKPIH